MDDLEQHSLNFYTSHGGIWTWSKEERQFFEKARKQRNRLAHGEQVSTSDALSCIRNVKQFLLCERANEFKGQISSYNSVEGHNLENLDDSAAVLNWLLTCKKKSLKLTLASSTSRQRVVRLALTLEHDLVGRAEVLERILSLLCPTGLRKEGMGKSCVRVVIHGPTGIGKTALVRRVAHLAKETLSQQHLFQAISKETLATDILSYLCSTGVKCDRGLSRKTLFSNFKESLQQSDQSLLLIFEDVHDPAMVLSLLPYDKHCVLFTSSNESAWKKLGPMPIDIIFIEIDSLRSEECRQLFENVLATRGSKMAYQKHCRTPVTKNDLSRFLSDDLLGSPLAIRLFAFHFCTTVGDASNFRVRLEEHPSSRRWNIDTRAAGVIHIRGFHHVVHNALKNLSEDKAAVDTCFVFSLLPENVPTSYIEQICQSLNISTIQMNQSFSALSDAGLVCRNQCGWWMHPIVRCLVRNTLSTRHELKQKTILEAVIWNLQQTTLGTLDEPLAKVKEGWSDVFSFGHIPGCEAVRTVLEQQQLFYQLKSALYDLVYHSGAFHLDWELRDTCSRCLVWCSQRTQPVSFEYIQSMICRSFTDSQLYEGEIVEPSRFEREETFLNFVSARWVLLDPESNDTFDRIASDIEKCLSFGHSFDLNDLLVKVAESLLPTGVEILERKQAGQLVLRIFARYGVSTTSLEMLLQNLEDTVTFKCALCFCRAIAAADQLEEAEETLKSVVRYFRNYWRDFRVDCKDFLVQQILTLAVQCECLKKYDMCLFWSDVAFDIDSRCTDISTTPYLSLQACICACKGIFGLALEKEFTRSKFWYLEDLDQPSFSFFKTSSSFERDYSSSFPEYIEDFLELAAFKW